LRRPAIPNRIGANPNGADLKGNLKGVNLKGV
jgi:hypothetical protein